MERIEEAKKQEEQYRKPVVYREFDETKFEFRSLEDSEISHLFEAELKIENEKPGWFYKTGKSLCSILHHKHAKHVAGLFDNDQCWEESGQRRPFVCGRCLEHYGSYDVRK